jgi:hypothetical protein
MIVLLLGVLGPWQKTLFSISANGLEVEPLLLVPALLLAATPCTRTIGAEKTSAKASGSG